MYPNGTGERMDVIANRVFGADFDFNYVGCGVSIPQGYPWETSRFGYKDMIISERDDGLLEITFTVMWFERLMFKNIKTPNDEPDKIKKFE